MVVVMVMADFHALQNGLAMWLDLWLDSDLGAWSYLSLPAKCMSLIPRYSRSNDILASIGHASE
jgi:hypothetical protein